MLVTAGTPRALMADPEIGIGDRPTAPRRRA
jgi:hypothetical protein